jgi:hypothetical protein
MYVQTVGTRAQVWHGTAKKTSGGLMKSNLMKNKSGRIVSKAKHNTAKKEMRLVKYGYGTKKGEFGMVKLGSRKRKSRRNKSKKMRGGYPTYSPADVNDSYMIKDVVPQEFGPQERALVGGRSMRKSMGRSMGKAKSMGKSMGRSMGMTGGTGMKALMPSDLGSDNVQFMAGNAA